MTVRAATLRVNGVRLHHLHAGQGPPVLLLHGWPQTSYMWRHVLPSLAEHHTVIAPDLRGYGLSDKPTGGFDKRTMAADVRALVVALGHDRVSIVAHDRGARVAHRYALEHPEEVTRLALLDIIPTREVLRRMDARLAAAFWHWAFHLQPDLPELLVGDRIREYLEFFFERWTHQRTGLDAEAVRHYVEAFERPGALRAGFDDYRATETDDATADDASAEAGQRLEMPLLVLWGAEGLVGTLPVLEIWEAYARDVRAEAIPECGHFLAEEQPAVVLERLLEFLAPERA